MAFSDLQTKKTGKSLKYSEKIWVEKYRPKELKDIIIPNRLRVRFEEGIGSNLLFGGTSGLGKTTLARILAKGRSMLFIDGSTTRGIDVVRSQIADFGSMASLTSNKKKVIIIDEADQFSSAAQKSLKATIEKYSDNVFFILTANNPERLDAPLHSRLEFISFNFSDEEELEQQKQYVKRIKGILQIEGRWSMNNEAWGYVLRKVYPDLRKIINLLYQATRGIEEGTKLTITDISRNYSGENRELYDMILTEHRPDKLYTFIRQNYNGKEILTLNSLGTNFLEYLNGKPEYQGRVLGAAMITHKYMYEATTGSIDALLPLLACIGALSDLLK